MIAYVKQVYTIAADDRPDVGHRRAGRGEHRPLPRRRGGRAHDRPHRRGAARRRLARRRRRVRLPRRPAGPRRAGLRQARGRPRARRHVAAGVQGLRDRQRLRRRDSSPASSTTTRSPSSRGACAPLRTAPAACRAASATARTSSSASPSSRRPRSARRSRPSTAAARAHARGARPPRPLRPAARRPDGRGHGAAWSSPTTCCDNAASAAGRGRPDDSVLGCWGVEGREHMRLWCRPPACIAVQRTAHLPSNPTPCRRTPAPQPNAPPIGSVEKCEGTLRRTQCQRGKPFEIKPPTVQAELVEACLERSRRASFQRKSTDPLAGRFAADAFSCLRTRSHRRKNLSPISPLAGNLLTRSQHPRVARVGAS